MPRPTPQTRTRTGEDPWLGRLAVRWFCVLALAWGGFCAAAQAQMMDIANRQQQFLLANRAYATSRQHFL